jgi:hypothetical protein
VSWLRTASIVWLTAVFGSTGRLVAGMLTLATDFPPDQPLVIAPGTTSAPVHVSITNDVAVDPAEHALSGWQVTLAIVPDAGAVGSVEFSSVGQPNAGYVLETTSSFGLTVTHSASHLLAFDFNFPFSGGVPVPREPVAKLLELSFLASPDAQGSFGVVAVDGPGQTEWTDSDYPVLNRRTFANVPDGGGTVRVGAVSAAAPMLRPGDADQDLDFDQFDLIRVAQAGKYLSEQPCTWGEGDWNGAPGGRPGNPPPGDGWFNQSDLIAALRGATYRTGPYAAIHTSGQLDVAPVAGAAMRQVDLEYIMVPEPTSDTLMIVGSLALSWIALRRGRGASHWVTTSLPARPWLHGRTPRRSCRARRSCSARL